MSTILRDWFIPEDGIRRDIISAEIQHYLGNDATVRPGEHVIDGKKVECSLIRSSPGLVDRAAGQRLLDPGVQKSDIGVLHCSRFHLHTLTALVSP